MFRVKKGTQAFSISLFVRSIAKVFRRNLTNQRSFKRNNGLLLDNIQLPLDVIVEILKILPVKSLMRFRCVSKVWSSIISKRKDFIEFIVARSLMQPLHKLPVFIFHHCEPETFFTVSSTFSQSTKPAISLMPGPSYYYSFRYQYVRGFICCFSPVYDMVTIYNPTTRQCVPLPKIKSMALSQKRYCYFGYDQVMNQYKVLAMVIDSQELTQIFYVLTLGRDYHEWRKIQGNIDERLLPLGEAGVCIDGTIYYGEIRRKDSVSFGETMLLSFDIRSERFYRVRTPQTLKWFKLCLTIKASWDA